MKIAILAAGKGTRMLPLTKKKPKPLIEINEKPFIYYLLKNIINANFSEICLVVGYKGKMIKQWAKNNNYNIHFIEQGEQKGTAHAIKQLKPWTKKESFVVVMGDNLYSSNDLRKLNNNDKFNYLLAKKGNVKEFGELITDNNYLADIKEKTGKYKIGLINLGAYKFTREIYKAINNINKSERGELEITDALTLLAKKKKVKVKKIDDYWIDFGSKEDIKPTEEFVKEEFE